jgi:prepilin-type N-terminal cleavage/methylation domain-containing protein
MPFLRAGRRCRGFTVIELAAVIVITVVIGAIGYSAWRTHEGRTQVAEGVRAARAMEEAVVRAFRASGEVPASTAELAGAAAAVSSRRVESISVESGRIDLVYGGDTDSVIAGRRLSLTPYETATSEIVWRCGNDIPGPGERPLGFAGGGRQTQQIPTTIESRYLPANCR